MNSKSKNGLASILALAVAVLTATPATAASQAANASALVQPANLPAVRDVRMRRVGTELAALHGKYIAHRATGAQKAFVPNAGFLSVADDFVVIDAAADGDTAELVAALTELGAVDIVAFKRVVSARLPLASIPDLGDVARLRFARPARSQTRVGTVTSQGDPSMETDESRISYFVDGAGVTVGVLSDTFDCGASTPGDYATDIGTGDLPAGIEVLDDTACSAPGIDEGRAMMQLIHDVAPGADLSFHTAFKGAADFALGIEELAGCPPGSEPGCSPAADPADVIVDDVGYLATPMFQDGIIAQAVDVVAAAGVSYFSAAGNSARASWEGAPFVMSGFSPPGYGDGVAHDFDPGPGVDIYQKVHFPAGTTVISFQWDQPFFSVSGPPGAINDIDICVYAEPPGTAPLACGADPNFGGDPVEVFGFSGPGEYNIVIVKFVPAGGPIPGLMKYVSFNSGFEVLDSYAMTMASTTFGQNNAAGAIAVGAAAYFETPEFGTDPALLEPFSSAGGTPIIFDIAGDTILPEVRLRPQIVAPDGTNTTFFGSDYEPDGYPNFFGTSAAAPHAAAVAALLQDAFAGSGPAGRLTPDGIEDVLTSSALDMGPSGFDFDSGFGLIDGHGAVGSVDEGTACDGVADLKLTGTPNSGPGTFSATDSITLGDGVFEDATFIAPTHIFEDGFESGDTASWSTACP